MLRQPIIVVMGHVDHGKTSLLDCIRKTTVAKYEAGAITQHISASEIPLQAIKNITAPVATLFKAELTIPGLLTIDTPGHAAFTNLRKRGGSIADMAILVIDIMQGVQPQTVEAIEILKEYKTPFVVAANKIDAITGWRSQEGESFIKSFDSQRREVQEALDGKIYELMGQLSVHGFDTERFDRVKDFTKTIAIIPVSAKTGEGIPELLLFLSGITQRYMEKRLKTEEEGLGKGSILEVKFEKGLGTVADVILYDGVFRKGGRIVFGTRSGAASTNIRGLIKPRIGRMEYVESVVAAAGVRIFAPSLEEALPGAPIVAVTEKNEAEIKGQIETEVKSILMSTEKEGIILRADTLGSVEAISGLLKEEGIPVRKADVGAVTKRDIMDAAAVRAKNRYLGAILAFNVGVADEIAADAKSKNIPIIKSNVIYSLLAGFNIWREEEKVRERDEALAALVFPAQIKILPGFVFRTSKPAIVGIEVQSGVIRPDWELMNENGEIVGKIKSIQSEKETLQLAKTGDKVAIAMDEPTVGRQINEGDILLTAVPKRHAMELKEKYVAQLSDSDIALLDRIQKIRRG